MCTRRSRVLLWSPALKPIVTGHCHCKSSGFGCLFWTVICLDPEPVWIHDEGGVVVGAVNRTQTGHTIVVPGLRPIYGPDYYAAFIIDPDGYRIEAYYGPAETAEA